MKKIILASTSPRRKEILEKTRLLFSIEGSDYEEDMSLPLTPHELVKFLSLEKAKSVAKNHADALIIAADTIVAFEGKVLGKPHTREAAKEMLLMLNGKRNSIITGVAIIDTTTSKIESFSDEVDIYLKQLTESEIDNYIKSGEPLDKAGAYAIQGLGSVFIKKIDGDFFSAMGLPIEKIAEVIKGFGVYIL